MREAVRRPGAPDEPFGGLLRYTVAGYGGGLALGVLFDGLGWERSGLGQWAVRTLAGEGESLGEGFFALRRRFARATGSMAEAYGWGKALGMAVPWGIDAGSRLLGVDVYGVEGFYIPYFYALGDQIGANLAGLVYLRRTTGRWGSALGAYVQHPVMLASLAIVLLVPLGLLTARLLGFQPTTQVYTALETIAANLCWVPPLVGWIADKLRGQHGP
ncbi:MAG: hypothetical protein NZ742_08385 [Acidobacteria bacterium]|nr:hypothetical protein [Acidobacteriota bacterium]MDW7984790.1 hypothetical protein [Acidobacteriota bacterium]